MEARLTIATAFDVILAVTTLWVAWAALYSRDAFRSAVLFIVFGVLMAVIWLRLAAPDIALAEAAVGAGLTGVLLLETLGRFRRFGEGGPQVARRGGWWGLILALPLAALAAGLAAAGLAAAGGAPGLGSLVQANLARSGVAYPVTAVLLNFRSYDTLLEVAVLLLAVAATLSLSPGRPAPAAAAPVPPAEREIMLVWFVRRLAAVGLVVAAYLWWRGGTGPGGAFQGGTVLAAIYILLLVAGFHRMPSPWAARTRLVIAGGLVCFLAVAVAAQAVEGMLLDLPENWAKALIVFVEAALAISIGASLAALALRAEDG